MAPKFVFAAWLALAAAAGHAAPAAEAALDKRTEAVSEELRCLVCQNQTIADSQAELAVDLRRQVRELLTAGKSEKEVVQYMTERYGDFVVYRPPLNARTVLLWFGPLVLLVAGGGLLVLRVRRMAPDAPLPPAQREYAERLLAQGRVER